MKKRLLSIAIITASILSFNVSCSDDFVEREFHQEVEQSELTSLQEVQSFVAEQLGISKTTLYKYLRARNVQIGAPQQL